MGGLVVQTQREGGERRGRREGGGEKGERRGGMDDTVKVKGDPVVCPLHLLVADVVQDTQVLHRLRVTADDLHNLPHLHIQKKKKKKKKKKKQSEWRSWE